MSVTVSPPSFSMVEFDASRITDIATRLVAQVGLLAGTEVRVEVDEAIPLGRARLASVEPVVLDIEGGAIEDPKRPRHLGEASTAAVIGRLLFQAHDRLDPSFGAPPLGADLPIARRVAWDVCCVGRFAALGYEGQRQRWLYSFRNRHGFTDAADAAFAELWEGRITTFAAIERCSADALVARPAPA